MRLTRPVSSARTERRVFTSTSSSLTPYFCWRFAALSSSTCFLHSRVALEKKLSMLFMASKKRQAISSSSLNLTIEPDTNEKSKTDSEKLEIETDFDGETSSIEQSIKWSTSEKKDFVMFEKYLNVRKRRYQIINQIVATRVLITVMMTGTSYLLYIYHIADTYSPDGRNLSLGYQCKL